MNLPFFIAKRYLLSKRKKNFINIISILSMVVVAITTAALIIVLSVFNGLGDLLHSLNNSFDPEIKIEASEGKSFHATPQLLSKVQKTDGVAVVTEVIEDYAYARYSGGNHEANQVITIKGVSENFIDQNRIPKENIVEGKLRLHVGKVPYALVGQGVQNSLSITTHDSQFPLQLYYINSLKPGTIDVSQLYSHQNILPGGVFSIVSTVDENYVIVPLSFAQDLLNYDDKRTSLEIKTKNGSDILQVQENLKKTLGKNFTVLNGEEQHSDIYRILKMEKLFAFLALSILLAIGSINTFFSLMMLAIDKKKDISVLAAMGADQKIIRNIFLAEGGLISFIGAFIGLLLGGALCWVQQHFGLISMGMQSAVADGYPVKMSVLDFISTLSVIVLITLLISIRPATMAVRYSSVNNL